MNNETIEIGFPMEYVNEDGTIDNVVLLRPNEIKALEYKLQELERYKNIIDELETYLQRKYSEYVDMESNDAFVISLVLDTLRELKGE